MSPGWYKELKLKFEELGINEEKTLEECLVILSGINKIISIPSLNDRQKKELKLRNYEGNKVDMVLG